MGATVLESAVAELRAMTPEKCSEQAEKAIFAGVRIRARASDIAELQGRIERWIEEAMALDTEEEEVEFRLAVAFYPVKSIGS